MAQTLPTGEQIRFRSAKTGEHILDTYMESVEKGTRSLYDLIGDLFDDSGVFRVANFEFRFDASTDKLQVRVGNFSNSTSGWSDLTTFFSIEGAFSSSTSYNNFDIVTLTNKDVYIVHGLSSASTFADEAAFISSSNTEKIVDVSEAKDWAIKTDGQVSSTDYSSKAWAIGGTGVTDTASKGAAKEWATKTGSTVDGTDYSAKHYATTGNVATVSSGIANINTVAGAIAAVNTVSGISSDVTTVSGINANVTTVAGIHANTTTVAGISAAVSTVAGISSAVSGVNTTPSAVSAVNSNATNINALSTSANLTSMSNLGTSTNITNMANLNASGVITNIANLNASGVIANIGTTAGISTDVTSVANIASDVTSLANSLEKTYVVTVTNPGSGNVFVLDGVNNPSITMFRGNTYIFDLSNGTNATHPLAFKDGSGNAWTTGVTTTGTAGSSGAKVEFEVPSTAPSSMRYYCTAHGDSMGNTITVKDSNVSLVANSIANVNLTGGSIANVNTLAGLNTEISALGGITTAISGVNTISSAVSGVNAISSAVTGVNNIASNVTTVANNVSGVNSFADRYRIASSAPTSSNDVGDLYFDTTANELKVYKSSGWAAAGSTVNGTSARFTYNVSGTPTTLTGADANGNTLAYDAGFIDVYLNGVKQVNGTDVTVTSGTSVVFASALANGDTVDIVGFGTFNVAAISASNINSGTVPVARLGSSGTRDNTTFLRGDNTFAVVDTTNASNLSTGTLPNSRLSSVPNSALANSSITINGSAISLGGSVTVETDFTWETKTSAFNVASSKGYFVDTSSSSITATLPASPTAGDTVRFIDLSATFDTNNLTVARNGKKIQGDASDMTVATERAGFALVFSGDTQGWILMDK